LEECVTMLEQVNDNSILVAIAHREISPWKEIRRLGQEETWVSRFRRSGIRVIYYQSREPNRFQEAMHTIREFNRFRRHLGQWQGRFDKLSMKLTRFKESEFSYIHGDHELHVFSPSTYLKMHERNYALFKWFLESNSEKFLFRTNTSSYLNLNGINSYVNKVKSLDDFFGGVLINSGAQQFVSGAGMLLPRRTVEKFVSNWSLLDRHMIEDIALGRLAHRIGVPLVDLPRIDISSPDEFPGLKLNSLKTNFHFRCKGIQRPDDDIEIMGKLDLIFT
jgi:hypothetical protein